MSDIDTILRQIKPRVISWIHQDVAMVVSSAGGVTDHGKLTGLIDDDHTQYVHINTARSISAKHTFAPSTSTAPFILSANAQNQVVTGFLADGVNKSVISGAGISGGGSLATASITLAIGEGTLITVGADTVGITPGTTDYGYIGSTTTPWTAGWKSLSTLAGAGLAHSAGVLNITAGTMISVTAQTADAVNLANGTVQYQVPLTGATPFTPAWATTANDPGASIAVLRTDASGYLTLVRLKTDTISDKSGANLTLSPTGDITLDPVGNDVLPLTNYDINLGMINKKYLTLHAAELWVETLVAQDTIATIGGRILVSPTTMLIKNMVSSINTISNNSFETAGGGGADVFANWAEVAGSGTIVRQTAGYSGTYCAQLTAGSTFNTTIESDAISVADLTGYVLSFWMKVSNVTYPGRFRIWDVTNNVAIIDWTMGSPSLTWAGQLIVFATPLNCISIKIGFECPATNTYVASFDLVTLEWGVIYVKHNQMVSGDIAYMEAQTKVEFIGITSAAIATTGGFYYSCTRNLDGAGANDWFAGDALLNTGQIGDGYLDLYSLRSLRSASHIGPTIQGVYRWGTNFNDLAETWAIGNLNGLYGYGASDAYGSAFGLYHPTAASSFLTVDSVEGIRMWSRTGGANTNLAQWFANGTLRVGEYADSKSRIEISSGQINFVTRSASVDYIKMSLSTAGTITLGEVASGEYMTITADQLTMYAAGGEQLAINVYPWIRIGGVYNSRSRIELYDGHMDFVYRDSGAADHIKINITAAGLVVVGETTVGNVYISTSGIALRYGSTTYINLDTSGNALFGRDGGTYANAYWNASNSRLEFRTNATVKSYIDTDGALVVKTGSAYNRINALVFNDGTNDVVDLSCYSNAGSHFVRLNAYAIGSHTADIQIQSNTTSSYAAQTTLVASNNAAGDSAEVQLRADSTSSIIELNADAVHVYNGALNYWYALRSHNAGTYDIDGYIFHPLSTPLTSTSWDGDLRSTTSKTLIDLSAVFGAPAGIKAVLFRVEISDSAAGDYWFIMGPTNTSYRGLALGVQGLSAASHARGCLTVPCDGNGDVYFQNLASGASTMEVFLEIWGYWV